MGFLESRATTILVLALVASAGLLWDGFGQLSSASLWMPGAEAVAAPTGVAEWTGATASLQPPAAGWLPAVSARTLVVICHVLGLAMSFGAVIYLDLYLVRYLLFAPMPEHAVEVASFGSRLVIAGLGILWLTGLTFLAMYWFTDPARLDNPKLLAKAVIVAVLTLNGFVIHTRVLPMLARKVGRKILEGESVATVRQVLAVAAVSSTSWLFALVLGLASELNFIVPWPVLLAAYGLANLIVYGALSGIVARFARQVTPRYRCLGPALRQAAG